MPGPRARSAQIFLRKESLGNEPQLELKFGAEVVLLLPSVHPSVCLSLLVKAEVGLMLVVVTHFVWGLPLSCSLTHIKRDWLTGGSTGHLASCDPKAVKLFSQRGGKVC